jgi:predicted ATPase
VLLMLGPAFTATKGFTAAEVERTYGRVRELCRLTGEAERSRSALQGLRVCYMVRGNLAAAGELGEELLADGERDGSQPHRFDGHLALGIVNILRGRLDIARGHLEQALTLHESARLDALAHQPLGRPGVACLGHLATVLFLTGFIDQSKKRSSEAIEVAKAASHPYSMAQAFGSTAMANFFGRPLLDARNAVALVTLSEEQGFDFWRAQGLAMRGWANADDGRTEAGVLDLRQAVAIAETMGAAHTKVYALIALATALGRQGEVQEAFSLLTEQRRLADRTGIAVFNAPARLCEGELHLRRTEPDPEAAEACFREALDIARRQEAKILELRAAMALARLWEDQGKRAEARNLLAPIYAWFTEGFDSADLEDAKALVDELG